MATRQEIIEVIDALFEGRITPAKARQWALEEEKKTPPCEDPCSTLLTMRMITDPVVQKTDPWQKDLSRDREVLARGVPCPEKDLGKTVEAYWMGYTPGKKVVLCQIRGKRKRFLELIEESWEGIQTFYHKECIPITEKKGPSLSIKDVREKKKAFRTEALSKKEAIQWVVHQLQRKSAADRYEMLLRFYWELQGSGVPFPPEYMEQSSRTSSSLLRTAEKLTKKTEKRKIE